MTQIKINHPVEPNSIFAPGAFDSQIGKEVDFDVPFADAKVKGKIVGAKVVNEGTAVEVTIDFPGLSLPEALQPVVKHNIFEENER